VHAVLCLQVKYLDLKSTGRNQCVKRRKHRRGVEEQAWRYGIAWAKRVNRTVLYATCTNEDGLHIVGAAGSKNSNIASSNARPCGQDRMSLNTCLMNFCVVLKHVFCIVCIVSVGMDGSLGALVGQSGAEARSFGSEKALAADMTHQQGLVMENASRGPVEIAVTAQVQNSDAVQSLQETATNTTTLSSHTLKWKEAFNGIARELSDVKRLNNELLQKVEQLETELHRLQITVER
jgi:hypothetical protein